MPTIDQAVAALEKNAQRIALAKLELEAANAEKRELERVILPPLFLAARSKSFTLDNGTRATKRIGCFGRFPDDEPMRSASIKFLRAVGHESAIKTQLTATWGKGDYPIAVKALEHLSKDKSCVAVLKEDVHWATYQNIILEEVKAGRPVPLDEIKAEVYDEVTITKYGAEPMETIK